VIRRLTATVLIFICQFVSIVHEDVANAAQTVADGSLRPAKQVRAAYVRYAGREPSNSEIAFWTYELALGTPTGLIEAILQDQGIYLARSSNGSTPINYVLDTYQRMLGFTPAASAVAFRANQVKTAQGRIEFIRALIWTPEFRRTQAHEAYNMFFGINVGLAVGTAWNTYFGNGGKQSDLWLDIAASQDFFAVSGNSMSGFVAPPFTANFWVVRVRRVKSTTSSPPTPADPAARLQPCFWRPENFGRISRRYVRAETPTWPESLTLQER